MNIGIYAIHDVKADTFMRPFFLHNDELARRTFLDLVANPETDIARHPADFTLFRVGTWIDIDGHIQGDIPVSLGNGQEYVAEVLKQEQHRDLFLNDEDVPVGEADSPEDAHAIVNRSDMKEI